MLNVLYDIIVNICATWIVALYIVPQVTIFSGRDKFLSLMYNVVGVIISLVLSIALALYEKH